MSFHPATVLLTWVVLVALFARFGFFDSATTVALVVALAALFDSQALLKQFKRMRWLFLAAIISCSLTTQGEVVRLIPWLTYEGLHAAVSQCISLLMVLALVVLLLRMLTIDGLVSGLYVLTAPLGLLGFERRRFALRLSMTISQLTQIPNENLAERQMFSYWTMTGAYVSLSRERSSRESAIVFPELNWHDYLALAVLLIATAIGFLEVSSAF